MSRSGKFLIVQTDSQYYRSGHYYYYSGQFRLALSRLDPVLNLQLVQTPPIRTRLNCLVLSAVVFTQPTRTIDKTVLSRPRRCCEHIGDATKDKTVLSCPPTRTGQDKTVFFCPCRRCEQAMGPHLEQQPCPQ